MRILAFDIGDRRIGLAISDETHTISQGLETLKRKKLEDDLSRIEEIVKEYDIGCFVIGYPKHMNGTIGERAIMSENFSVLLKERYPSSEVILWDERLTTLAAEKVLLKADVRRNKRKDVIDKLAAVLILQGYLDSLKK